MERGGTVSHNKEAIVNLSIVLWQQKRCKHKTGMNQTFFWRIQIQANADVYLR